MNTTSERSVSVELAVDGIALVVASLALLFGGTQSGIVTPTFTWVTAALVVAGLGSGVAVRTHSTGDGREATRPRLSGIPLVLAGVGILSAGLLWVAFVPPVYGSDLVYGVLALFWAVYVLTCVDRSRSGR